MVTNEERKKVAERLREIDFEWVSDSSARLLFKIEHVLGLYVEGVDNLEGVSNRLADLIEPEEFTCKNLATRKDDFACSVCECEVVGCMIDDFGSWENPLLFCYCPNCGRKVVK